MFTKSLVKGLTKFSFAELFIPLVVVASSSLWLSGRSTSLLLFIKFTLCYLMMVLSLQVFVGNSGVLSFGHGSFAMVGAFVSGLATAPLMIKQNAMALSNLWQPLVDFKLNLGMSLLASAFAGGVFAAFTGGFLMRLNGLAAGIATFALLGITYNILFNNNHVGPSNQALPGVSQFSNLTLPLVLVLLAMIMVYFYNLSRAGRTLRATREDNLASRGLGINIIRVRWMSFTFSGVLAGLAGAMYAHVGGAVQVQDYYLGFTFYTLAMLIVGGSASLWGAVLGTVVVSGVSQILLMWEQSSPVFGITIHLPIGTRAIVIAGMLVIILLWRPNGISNGSEIKLPNFLRKIKAS